MLEMRQFLDSQQKKGNLNASVHIANDVQLLKAVPAEPPKLKKEMRRRSASRVSEVMSASDSVRNPQSLLANKQASYQ